LIPISVAVVLKARSTVFDSFMTSNESNPCIIWVGSFSIAQRAAKFPVCSEDISSLHFSLLRRPSGAWRFLITQAKCQQHERRWLFDCLSESASQSKYSSTDTGTMISIKPVPLNACFSTRDNVDSDSNLTKESDLQSQKRFWPTGYVSWCNKHGSPTCWVSFLFSRYLSGNIWERNETKILRQFQLVNQNREPKPAPLSLKTPTKRNDWLVSLSHLGLVWLKTITLPSKHRIGDGTV
jgi:hypothetical protein